MVYSTFLNVQTSLKIVLDMNKVNPNFLVVYGHRPPVTVWLYLKFYAKFDQVSLILFQRAKYYIDFGSWTSYLNK